MAKDCHHRFGIQVLLADLADYDAHTFALIPPKKYAIFILSTYGEGDPSDNAEGFWEWLHQDVLDRSKRLSNLRYMALGLGNSNYKYYNRVIDVMVGAFDKADAQQLMPTGKADDAKGETEEDFLTWKADLFDYFRNTLNMTEQTSLEYVPSIRVLEDTSLSPIDLNLGQPVLGPNHSSGGSSPAQILAVKDAKELYNSSTRSCIHLDLDISENAELKYRTGDHLAVFPINPDNEIDLLFRVLGIEEERANVPLLIQAIEEGDINWIPSPTTLAALFRYYLEICAPVSRETVRSLAKFAPSTDASEMLKAWSEDKVTYSSFMAQNHITMGRLLALAAPDLSWDKLPLSLLVEVIPRVKPRYYSISSSSVVTPRMISLTVGIESRILSPESATKISGVASLVTTYHVWHLLYARTAQRTTLSRTQPVTQ